MLYDDSKLGFELNRFVLISAIEFILSTERFNCFMIK